MDAYTDMFDATAPILFLMNDKSEEEKQEAFKAVMQSRNIPALAFFEKQLKKVSSFNTSHYNPPCKSIQKVLHSYEELRFTYKKRKV